MTHETIQTRTTVLFLESPSLIRMQLKGKITFEQAFGIEEFIRWRNRAVYSTTYKSAMIADFMRLRRDLTGREGHLGEIVLNRFVISQAPAFWSSYCPKYGKHRGWMKALILFVGERLDHVHGYFRTGEKK